MEFTLQDIIDTLNHVEVHGRENLDRLFGAIMALESLANSQKIEDVPTEGE